MYCLLCPMGKATCTDSRADYNNTRRRTYECNCGKVYHTIERIESVNTTALGVSNVLQDQKSEAKGSKE